MANDQPTDFEINEVLVYDTILAVFSTSGSAPAQLLSTSDVSERIGDHFGVEIDPSVVYQLMEQGGFKTIPAGGNLYWATWPKAAG